MSVKTRVYFIDNQKVRRKTFIKELASELRAYNDDMPDEQSKVSIILSIKDYLKNDKPKLDLVVNDIYFNTHERNGG